MTNGPGDACTYTRVLRFVFEPSASAHLRAQVKNGPRDACTCTCVLLLVFAPSASAHLRAQVTNGPGDACTYTRVLRFVFAAFCKCTPPGTGEERNPRCMHLYLRAAVRFCGLLQVHTSGDRCGTDPVRTRAASTDSIVLLKHRYGAVPEAQVVTPLPEGNIRPQLDNFCHQSFFVKGLHRLHV